jgi:cytochrome bd-type quinol oxidase subunit 2
MYSSFANIRHAEMICSIIIIIITIFTTFIQGVEITCQKQTIHLSYKYCSYAVDTIHRLFLFFTFCGHGTIFLATRNRDTRNV